MCNSQIAFNLKAANFGAKLILVVDCILLNLGTKNDIFGQYKI